MKFLHSKYESAIYRVKVPWGHNLESHNKLLFKRADIGCSVFLISNKEQEYFLSEETHYDLFAFERHNSRKRSHFVGKQRFFQNSNV